MPTLVVTEDYSELSRRDLAHVGRPVVKDLEISNGLLMVVHYAYLIGVSSCKNQKHVVVTNEL